MEVRASAGGLAWWTRTGADEFDTSQSEEGRASSRPSGLNTVGVVPRMSWPMTGAGSSVSSISSLSDSWRYRRPGTGVPVSQRPTQVLPTGSSLPDATNSAVRGLNASDVTPVGVASTARCRGRSGSVRSQSTSSPRVEMVSAIVPTARVVPSRSKARVSTGCSDPFTSGGSSRG